MRKLLFFGMGFCAACAIGAYLLDSLWLLVPALLALALAVVLLYRFRKPGWQRKLAFGALGMAVGMLWFCIYGLVFWQPAKAAEGKSMRITATAVDYSYDTGYGNAVTAEIKLSGRSYRCVLYLNTAATVAPGDGLQGEFYLQYTGVGGEKDGSYHSGSGIFLVGYQRGELMIEPASGAQLQYLPARLRNAILGRIELLFPADAEAFAKALLLGDRRDMDYETETALTVSGIVHVVSVSGLHVSILLSALYLLLGRRRILTPVLGFSVLILIAAVTGFSASVVRACLMNGLTLLALMLEKEYDPLTAVTFSLTVMLGCNPMAVTSVGLQLSAASVVGIHLFVAPVTDWIRRWNLWADVKPGGILSRLRDSISATIGVSIAATVATAPLSAIHFGTVSLIGWLTNLLALWIINLVFVGILLCLLLSLLWQSGALWVGAMLSGGIRLSLWIAKLLSRFPLAAVYTQSPYIAAWLVFAYGMLAIFIVSKHKKRGQLCFWTALTLAAAIAFSWIEPRTEQFRMTALDVGQGQCVLLQSQGRAYMVDCGGSGDENTADKAVAALHSQGIFRLDGLILTHYDRDHTGGASYLLSRIDVNMVYLPKGEEMESCRSALRETGAHDIEIVDADTTISWGDAKLTLYTFGTVESSNESSLCILFQKENYDILITGDQTQLGEKVLLHGNDLPQIDVLVVGHHGADTSTGAWFLSQLRPAVAVISVGRDNPYGHPQAGVLQRLEDAGCQIRRTDLEGTIIIKR